VYASQIQAGQRVERPADPRFDATAILVQREPLYLLVVSPMSCTSRRPPAAQPSRRTCRWRAAVIAGALFATGLAAAAPPATTPGAALNALLEDYWRDLLRFHPDLALEQGDTTAAERFDDSLEDGWRRALLAALRADTRRARGIDAARLREEDRISLAMLQYRLREDLAFYGSALFETARRLPIDQFQGRHTRYALEAAGAGDYPFKTVADYDRALVRADRYARWTDEAIARLREGLRSGVVLPRLVVERILPQLETHLARDPETTDFWRPIAALPADFPAADRERLAASFRTSIADVIEPAYRRLHDFLANEYLPHARSSVGLSAVPGGPALYRYYARFHTTTALTPAEIHALGLAEVERISGELAGVQRALGIAGGASALFAAARGDGTQKFTERAEIIPAFEAARRTIEARLPQLFDVAPRAEYQIRALPESSRASQGNGNYAPAAADGSRPGILWINTYAPGVQDRFNVMTISLHEGLPGHHFQTSLAQEQTGLPSLRRFDSTTAYVEGWGLYAESLGRELGVFGDPWQYFGHLNYALLRADRLVIDTGIHGLGWDVAAGVRFMTEHSSMSEAQATAEVERYVAYPGQALAYKVGELRIRALRAEAERALGTGFDLRAFHDQVLLGGSMPLEILQQKLRRWIAKTRHAAAPAPAGR
jgi:uncharacterized protein (DUF885 family)